MVSQKAKHLLVKPNFINAIHAWEKANWCMHGVGTLSSLSYRGGAHSGCRLIPNKF